MDAYPPEYVHHNLPFVVLSGLGSRSDLDPPTPVHQVLPGRAAVNVSSDAPLVTDQRAEPLLDELLAYDAATTAAAATRNGGGGAPVEGIANAAFRMRAVGRVGQPSHPVFQLDECSSGCSELPIAP